MIAVVLSQPVPRQRGAAVLPEDRRRTRRGLQRVRAALLTLIALSLLLFLLRPGAVPQAAAASTPFVPPNGQSYFGLTIREWDGAALTDPAYGDTRSFPDRYRDAIHSELGGKSPSLYGVPTTWQDASGRPVGFQEALKRIQKFRSVDDAGAPVLSWNAQTGWENTRSDYSGITTATVAGGSLDDYIRSYAREVKAFGRPIFIRPICGEVNGNWWRSCSPNANSKLTKEMFIAAWRRVVGIFRDEAAHNVAWIWNLNTFPAPPANWGIDQDIAGYYPGDDYVDWVGADHYDYGDPSKQYTDPLNVATYLDPHYAFAAARDKPFMLPEWGIRHRGGQLTPPQQQTFIDKMFAYFAAHPLIKGHVYFDRNMNGPADEDSAHLQNHVWLAGGAVNYHPNVNDGDHRLIAGSGADFVRTFASAIGDSRYVSNVAGTTVPVHLSVTPAAVTSGSAADVTLRWRPSAEVQLYADDASEPGPRIIRTGRTDADGRATFRVYPPRNTRLQAVGGDGTRSSEVLVTARLAVTLGAKRTGTRRYTFSGGTWPALAGRAVALYRSDGRTGSRVLCARGTTDARGRFSITRVFTGSGSFAFSVLAAGDSRNAAGTSRARPTVIH